MRAEEKKLLDMQFKGLGDKMSEVNSKIDKFIDESKEERKHLTQCLTKIKVETAENSVKINDDRRTLKNHEITFGDHLKSHDSERNKTIATGGGLGGFLSLVVAFIMSKLS